MHWYLVEEEGRLTAVDAGLPGFKGSLVSDLGTLGFGPSDVEAVILTHSDPDHTGVAGALQEAGATVMIHSADEPKLRRPGPKPGDASPLNAVREMWRPTLLLTIGRILASGGAIPTRVQGARTFEGEELLEVPGRPRAIQTPGHTPGHCAFLFETHRALFVGDELCTWNVATGSRGPQLMPRVMNVSTEQCYQSLAALEDLEADVLLPGHGEPWRDGVGSALRQARDRHG